LVFIIPNSLNKVVYAYGNIIEILKKDFKRGRPVLKILENLNLVQIVEKV
jgi:hypothetical protein